MKTITLYIALILGLSYSPNKKESTTTPMHLPEYQCHSNPFSPLFLPSEEPYVLTLKMNEVGNDLYDLKIHMKLNDGAYYVSPNSKGDFKGIFNMHINMNSKLERIEKLIEKPLSVEEFDPHPFVNGYVNWVRESTTYTQRFQRKSNNNFKVSGTIQFTIEPNCTLEQIPFVISYEQGKLKIEVVKC